MANKNEAVTMLSKLIFLVVLLGSISIVRVHFNETREHRADYLTRCAAGLDMAPQMYRGAPLSCADTMTAR
jgi:hypothetical protein